MLSFVGQEPNWLVVSLVGAVMGALVAKYGSVLTYPVRRFHRVWMEGDWNLYHLTFQDGETTVVEGVMTIKKGVLSGLTVDIRDRDDRDALRYRGKASIEGQHLTVRAEASSHVESIGLRFINKIPQPGVIIPGLWLAFDKDGNPASGALIATRSSLTDDAVSELVRRYTDTHTGAMRVHATPRPGKSRRSASTAPLQPRHGPPTA